MQVNQAAINGMGGAGGTPAAHPPLARVNGAFEDEIWPVRARPFSAAAAGHPAGPDTYHHESAEMGCAANGVSAESQSTIQRPRTLINPLCPAARDEGVAPDHFRG